MVTAVSRGLFAVGTAFLLGGSREIVFTQSTRLEYRVVFANARELVRRLDEAGQQGFACTMIARPESTASVPGVVVVMSRAAGAAPAAVTHRVIKGGGGGTDLAPLLDRAGAEGYRLCGVAFDEEGTVPSIVAVMTEQAGSWRYGAEVLSDYRGALARLNTAGKDGFAPVGASPVNNNRVPAMRSWVVITERPASGRPAVEVAVRSGSGPDALQKSLVEQSGQGYRVALVWKEGNDIVALMTRSPGTSALSYAAESAAPSGLHGISRPYVADVPYLSDRILVITEQSGSVSNELVEDSLPALGAIGYAAPGALGTLGDHLSRLHDYTVGSVVIRRGDRDALVLRTVLTHR